MRPSSVDALVSASCRPLPASFSPDHHRLPRALRYRRDGFHADVPRMLALSGPAAAAAAAVATVAGPPPRTSSQVASHNTYSTQPPLREARLFILLPAPWWLHEQVLCPRKAWIPAPAPITLPCNATMRRRQCQCQCQCQCQRQRKDLAHASPSASVRVTFLKAVFATGLGQGHCPIR